VTRIEAKDIKSVATDIKALEKLLYNSNIQHEEAEIYEKDGDLFEIF
jgi:hypothetical protein